MATTQYETDRLWQSAARFTAPAETAVYIANHSQDRRLFFTITTDDTAPTEDWNKGSFIPKGETRSFVLSGGERIWFAGDNCYVTVET